MRTKSPGSSEPTLARSTPPSREGAASRRPTDNSDSTDKDSSDSKRQPACIGIPGHIELSPPGTPLSAILEAHHAGLTPREAWPKEDDGTPQYGDALEAAYRELGNGGEP